MKNNLLIKQAIKNTISIKTNLLNNEEILGLVDGVAEEMIKTFKAGKKVLFCGNGGSAADAQHLAAELSGKYYLDREPLPAEPLNINTSFLTAVANDISYDEIFSRLIRAIGKPKDILFAISTSGNSENVIKAIITANARDMVTVGLTGETGGRMKGLCRFLIKVPSRDVPRIQESHILLGHIICEIVEKRIFGNAEKNNTKTI